MINASALGTGDTEPGGTHGFPAFSERPPNLIGGTGRCWNPLANLIIVNLQRIRCAAGQNKNVLFAWRVIEMAFDGGSAYGIAQWHSDRQANFQRFIGHGIVGSTFAEQLSFVQFELTRGAETAAGVRLRSASSATQAGTIVSQFDERPADVIGEAARRGRIAEQILSGYR